MSSDIDKTCTCAEVLEVVNMEQSNEKTRSPAGWTQGFVQEGKIKRTACSILPIVSISQWVDELPHLNLHPILSLTIDSVCTVRLT